MIPFSNEKYLETIQPLLFPKGFSYTINTGNVINEYEKKVQEALQENPEYPNSEKMGQAKEYYDKALELLENEHTSREDLINLLNLEGANLSLDSLNDLLDGFMQENKANQAYYAEQNSIARQWASNEAKLAFEREMQASNTAYQRGFEDMKKAGVNPYAVLLGGGSSPSASTPSFSPASSSFNVASRSNNLGNAINAFLKNIDVLSQSAYRESSISSKNAATITDNVVGLLGNLAKTFALMFPYI